MPITLTELVIIWAIVFGFIALCIFIGRRNKTYGILFFILVVSLIVIWNIFIRA